MVITGLHYIQVVLAAFTFLYDASVEKYGILKVKAVGGVEIDRVARARPEVWTHLQRRQHAAALRAT